MLGKILAVAVLLLGAPIGSQAAEDQPQAAEAMELAAGRLQKPEEFGRFADNSRSRPDSVVVAGDPAGSTLPARPQVHGLVSGDRLPESVRREVPAPRIRASHRDAESDPFPLLWGLGAGGLVVGAFLLAWGGSRESPRIAPPLKSRPVGSPPRMARGTPPPEIRLFKPPNATPIEWDPLQVRPAAADPPAHEITPRDPRWWAITWQEQLAIDRWDRSIEKEFAVMVSLEDWLDAHAKDLPGVDVDQLKAKLNRAA